MLLIAILLVPMLVDAFAFTLEPHSPCRSLTVLDAATTSTDSTRRSLLVASIALVGGSGPAFAKYGDSSSMELPSYIDYLIEKNSSSGETKILYKGADPATLLRRLQEADKRLVGDIPALAAQKKWSQIQGILTGPLGTFSQTLNQIAPASDSTPPQVQEASKKIKSGLIAIGQAAAKKNGDACTALAQQASQDLEAFVKVAFQ
jgi:hypothetical protein